jgi:hypothetical protein
MVDPSIYFVSTILICLLRESRFDRIKTEIILIPSTNFSYKRRIMKAYGLPRLARGRHLTDNSIVS